jgi:hypothetical protein
VTGKYWFSIHWGDSEGFSLAWGWNKMTKKSGPYVRPENRTRERWKNLEGANKYITLPPVISLTVFILCANLPLYHVKNQCREVCWLFPELPPIVIPYLVWRLYSPLLLPKLHNIYLLNLNKNSAWIFILKKGSLWFQLKEEMNP